MVGAPRGGAQPRRGHAGVAAHVAQIIWWRAACRPGGGPGRPGRDELRQRLLRRGAGHRRGAGRPAAPGRLGAGLAGGRPPRRPAVLRRWPGRPGWPWPPPPAGGCWSVGAACLAAGWLYTGGPSPTATSGWASCSCSSSSAWWPPSARPTCRSGTARPGSRFAAAVPVGLLATALLEANNLRDIDGDAVASKRTLAVRLGRTRAGWLYVGSLALAAAGHRPVGLLATLGPARPARPSRWPSRPVRLGAARRRGARAAAGARGDRPPPAGRRPADRGRDRACELSGRRTPRTARPGGR